MKRRFVDTRVFESRNMQRDGNIDFKFWHDKSLEERLHAAAVMIGAAFGEPDFLSKRMDKTIFSSRKHSNQ